MRFNEHILLDHTKQYTRKRKFATALNVHDNSIQQAQSLQSHWWRKLRFPEVKLIDEGLRD